MQPYRHVDLQKGKLNKQVDLRTRVDLHTDRLTDRQTDGQIDLQKYIQTRDRLTKK